MQLIFFQQVATDEMAFLSQTPTTATEHSISAAWAAEAGGRQASADGACDRLSHAHRSWLKLSLQTSCRHMRNESSKICPSFCFPCQEERAAGADALCRGFRGKPGESRIHPNIHPGPSWLSSALKLSVIPSRAVGTDELTVIPGTCSLGHFSEGQGNSK